MSNRPTIFSAELSCHVHFGERGSMHSRRCYLCLTLLGDHAWSITDRRGFHPLARGLAVKLESCRSV